jgi:hypothetical protein
MLKHCYDDAAHFCPALLHPDHSLSIAFLNAATFSLSMLHGILGLAGMSPWVLMDFSTRRLTGIQDYCNRKRLISDCGQKKQAFFIVEKFCELIAKSGGC